MDTTIDDAPVMEWGYLKPRVTFALRRLVLDFAVRDA